MRAPAATRDSIAAQGTNHTGNVSSKWFKELKLEIKDKLEIIEEVKWIEDLRVKRLPDIDLKGVREDIELSIFDRLEDEWAHTVRTIASTIDQTNAELSRAFIGKEERPAVGPPEPEIEELHVREISAEEAERHQEKEGFADGDDRELTMAEGADDVHTVIHSLWKSQGRLDLRSADDVAEAAERIRGEAGKSPAKKRAAKKSPAKKRAAKKPPAKRRPRTDE